jgi:hypothetical protein
MMKAYAMTRLCHLMTPSTKSKRPPGYRPVKRIATQANSRRADPPEYTVAAAGAGKEGLIDERGASEAARRAGAGRRGPGSGPEP